MSDFISKIVELIKKDDQEKLVEKLLEDQLKIEPNNIDLWLRLALLELELPFADNDRGRQCLEKIFAIDPKNPIAAMVLAYLDDLVGERNEKSFNRLNSIHTQNNELNSMLRYVACWFYWFKDGYEKQEEQLLKESISLYSGHVRNYRELADLYFKQGRNAEAKELMQKALKNVKRIQSYDSRIRKIRECDVDGTNEIIEDLDHTDVNKLLDEYVKGTRIGKSQFENIKRKCIQIELWQKLGLSGDNPSLENIDKNVQNPDEVATALIIIAYLAFWGFLGINEELLGRLVSFHANDAELNSMLKYMASKFYWFKEGYEKQEEQLLEESVKIYSGHIRNNVRLANIYFKQGRNAEAKELMQKALKNVKKVYTNAEIRECDPTDIDEFINEHIKGIHVISTTFEYIKETALE